MRPTSTSGDGSSPGAAPPALLQQLAFLAAGADTMEAALCRCLDRLCRHLDWPVGHIVLEDPRRRGAFTEAEIVRQDSSEEYGPVLALLRSERPDQPGTPVREVVSGGDPCWYPEISRDPRFRTLSLEEASISVLAFPLVADGRVLGVIEMFGLARPSPGPERLSELEQVGAHVGRIVERREASRQIVDLALQEQRRIGQELHDTVGQQVTALDMMLSTLRRKIDSGEIESASRSARRLQEVVRETKEQVRALSRGLVPIEVGAGGLPAALQELAESAEALHGIDCSVHLGGRVVLDDPFVATQLLRIAQEGVHDAVKRGEAGSVLLKLQANGGQGRLEVASDGKPPPRSRRAPAGQEMRIMRYRAGLVGASLRLEESPESGARLICTFRVKDRTRKDEASP